MRSAFIVTMVTMPMIVCTPSAYAGELAFSLKTSTIGSGTEAVTDLAPHLDLRGVIHGSNYSQRARRSGIDFNGNPKLYTAGILVDYLPWSSSNFHLTGGGLYNDNTLVMNAITASGNYAMNGHADSAPPLGSLNGAAMFNRVLPYVGIGYGNAIKGTGLDISFDLGAIYPQGTPTTSLTTGDLVSGLAADYSF